MPEMSLEHVTNNYLDVLREIGNIGAGNAMTDIKLLASINLRMTSISVAPFSLNIS